MSLRLKFSTGSQITDLNQGQWDDVAGGGGATQSSESGSCYMCLLSEKIGLLLLISLLREGLVIFFIVA